MSAGNEQEGLNQLMNSHGLLNSEGGMSKKMKKKMKHVPAHIRHQIEEKMPGIDMSQLDQAGGMEAIMRSGQNIAQRAINQNVKEIKDIEKFLTQDKTKQEILDSGHQVLSTLKRGETTCEQCSKVIDGRSAHCLRCTAVYYCNGNCRKQHYKVHKKQCNPNVKKEEEEE